jgi:hypothetical protein
VKRQHAASVASYYTLSRMWLFIAARRSQQISVKHLFFECPVLLKLYEEKSLKMKNFDISSIFDSDIIVDIVKMIFNSPVCCLL